MPRIRKKTSNRVKSRDREKRKKQVRDGRKKKAKATKKNPQWKSKKPKDPGIPNDFPYKDQILAEVQEQRRIAAEDKMRLKEEKLAKGSAMQVDAEGIASLSAKTINAELKRREQPPPPVVEMEEEEPPLFNHDLPNLLAVLEKSDVILQVLDARDPLAFRSNQVEDTAVEKGKKILFVLNKIDRCPREAVAAWSKNLRAEQPTLMFRSASAFLPEEQSPWNLPSTKTGKAKVPINDALGVESIISCLCEWAKAKDVAHLTVAVVGLANVGKSSLINSLLKKSTLPVYTLSSSPQGPTTTELPQEVSLDANGATITFVDTPGLSFSPQEGVDESIQLQTRAKDILLRSKGRIDRLKDPMLPIPHIVSRANNEDLMLLYNLPAFPKGDSSAFLSGVARANHLVKKKGDLDRTSAARIVLRDWNSGKFARYTTPLTPAAPPTKSSSDVDPISSSFFTPLYAKDEAVLAVLATRKEIRKKGGLVKLIPSQIEGRRATLEKNWAPLEDDEDESNNDDERKNDDNESVVVDDDEEEEEEEESKGEGEEQGFEEGEEDEEESSPDSESKEEKAAAIILQSRKRKRKLGSVATHPAKRVTLDLVSSSKVTKDRLLRRSDPSGAKHKTELVAAVPKIKAAPKSILKKTQAGKAVKKLTMQRSQTAGKERIEERKKGDEPEAYDFGKFY